MENLLFCLLFICMANQSDPLVKNQHPLSWKHLYLHVFTCIQIDCLKRNELGCFMFNAMKIDQIFYVQ